MALIPNKDNHEEIMTNTRTGMASSSNYNNVYNDTVGVPQNETEKEQHPPSLTRQPSSSLEIIMERLDSLDKMVSRPMFRAKIPLWLECILSVPGNFFGIPLFACLLLPNTLTWWFLLYFQHEETTNQTIKTAQLRTHTMITWKLSIVVCWILSLLLWIYVLKGVRKAIRFCYNPKLSALTPLWGVLLLCQMQDTSTHDDALTATTNNAACPTAIHKSQSIGFFQISAWCLSIIPVALFKPKFARQRPAVTWYCTSNDNETESDDQDTTSNSKSKHLSTLPRLFCKDGNSSFPSGDAAGATALCYPLFRCSTSSWLQRSSSTSSSVVGGKLIAILCVVLSCAGRLYWQAHHLGDVLGGILLALLCCWCLEQYYHNLNEVDDHGLETNNHDHCSYDCHCHSAKWWHPIVAQCIVIVILIFSRLVNSKKSHVAWGSSSSKEHVSTPNNVKDKKNK